MRARLIRVDIPYRVVILRSNYGPRYVSRRPKSGQREVDTCRDTAGFARI